MALSSKGAAADVQDGEASTLELYRLRRCLGLEHFAFMMQNGVS